MKLQKIEIQPAFVNFALYSAEKTQEHCKKEGKIPFFGGEVRNTQEGLICEIMSSIVLFSLEKAQIYDQAFDRDDHDDITIEGKKFQIKGGARDNLNGLGKDNFTPQVPQEQFDSGRGSGVFGYIFVFVDREFKNAVVAGWIESNFVRIGQDFKEREIRPWYDKKGKLHHSYIIPWAELKELKDI